MVSIGKVFSFLSRSAQKTMPSAAEVTKVPLKTKVMTDIDTGIIRMEREFSKNGDTFLARVERQKLPNGGEKTTTRIYAAKPDGGYYFGQGDEGLRTFREKEVLRNTKGSILGGDRVQINKNYHNTFSETGHYYNLTKDYNPQGVLEHKELAHKYSHWPKPKNAVQDRVYNEFELSSGSKGMLNDPYNSQYIQHSLDGKNNYYKFGTDSTKYSRAVAAKEQAAIDAAKKAEAEALAAKEAAEKAAAELRAKQPRINIAKALNRDINDLVSKETKLADGTIERTFSDPVTGKVLAKTQDSGLLHKEWIYGGKADMIYMKQVGDEMPYLLAKKGNYVQLNYLQESKYGLVPTQVKEQYYYDGLSSLKRSYSSGEVFSDASGYVTVFDKTAAKRRETFPSIAEQIPDYPAVYIHQGKAFRDAYETFLSNAQIKANAKVAELNKDAQQCLVNLEDLFEAYKA